VSNTKTETRGNVLHVELMHPRIKGNVDTVEVNLCDVRAADGIRIRYDFARDGWSILQASRFEWELGEEPDGDWQEVAFVQAWAREVPEEPET
jgi:hypothetical protein